MEVPRRGREGTVVVAAVLWVGTVAALGGMVAPGMVLMTAWERSVVVSVVMVEVEGQRRVGEQEEVASRSRVNGVVWRTT